MNILIVDDDEKLSSGLRRKLRCDGWLFSSAVSGEEALENIESVDMLVTDLRLPGIDGIELMRRAMEKHPQIEVVVMTGYGTIPNAVEAMREGARAYLTKPFDTEELRCHIRDVQRLLEFRTMAGKFGRGDLVGGSRAMEHIYTEIDIAASSGAPVLITGETGTGKELAARAVHNLSSRRAGPFVAVNLGAIPAELAEGELFGHEKGAFTGAASARKGKFQVARDGTLFLDEINSLPLELQPKLLRAIETRETWPLGSEQPDKVELRIIAAANSSVEELVQKKEFRQDLYYRLNVIRINMPPLREHAEDIPAIAGVLLKRIQERNADTRNVVIAPDVLARLIKQPWPGNVRELSNTLERAYTRLSATVAADSEEDLVIDSGCIGVMTAGPSKENLVFKDAKAQAADDWARKAITDALVETQGNISNAAKLIKMNRSALMRLMKKYGMSKDTVIN